MTNIDLFRCQDTACSIVISMITLQSRISIAPSVWTFPVVKWKSLKLLLPQQKTVRLRLKIKTTWEFVH